MHREECKQCTVCITGYRYSGVQTCTERNVSSVLCALQDIGTVESRHAQRGMLTAIASTYDNLLNHVIRDRHGVVFQTDTSQHQPGIL